MSYKGITQHSSSSLFSPRWPAVQTRSLVHDAAAVGVTGVEPAISRSRTERDTTSPHSDGLGGETRTPDLLLPRQARYHSATPRWWPQRESNPPCWGEKPVSCPLEDEAVATLGRFELAISRLRAGVPRRLADRVVEAVLRFELRIVGLQPTAFPLGYTAVALREGFEPTTVSLTGSRTTVVLPQNGAGDRIRTRYVLLTRQVPVLTGLTSNNRRVPITPSPFPWIPQVRGERDSNPHLRFFVGNGGVEPRAHDRNGFTARRESTPALLTLPNQCPEEESNLQPSG